MSKFDDEWALRLLSAPLGARPRPPAIGSSDPPDWPRSWSRPFPTLRGAAKVIVVLECNPKNPTASVDKWSRIVGFNTWVDGKAPEYRRGQLGQRINQNNRQVVLNFVTVEEVGQIIAYISTSSFRSEQIMTRSSARARRRLMICQGILHLHDRSSTGKNYLRSVVRLSLDWRGRTHCDPRIIGEHHR